LQHRLAAVAEAGRLDCDALERAANLVDHQRGERLAFDVFGDDDELLAGLHHFLEHRQHVAHRGNLGAEEEDVRLVDHGFHTVGVGHEIRRDVALVETHALDEIHLDAERLALFDGDDAVFADLVDGLGDPLADLSVGGRYRRNLRDLRLVVDFLGERLDAGHGRLDGLLDAALQAHRVGAGRDVAQTFVHHRPGQHGGGGRAVACDVVSLLRDFLHQFGADALVRVFEFDFFSDRHAVVGDGRGAPLLVEHDVAALGSKGDAHGVGELVHAGFEAAAGCFVKEDDLGHRRLLLRWR